MSICYINRAQSTSKVSRPHSVIVLLVSVDTLKASSTLFQNVSPIHCVPILHCGWRRHCLVYKSKIISCFHNVPLAHLLSSLGLCPFTQISPPTLIFFSLSSLFPFSPYSPQLIIHTHHIHDSKYTVQVITSPHTSTNLPTNQQLCGLHQLHTHKQHQQ
jgi:hypothetical protein